MRDSQHLLGRAPLWLGAAAILVASVLPALADWEEDLAAQLR
ncbi:MAG TPA: hypothetical protein VHK24_05270 [Steroidobacter sp.]|nr:hypothetical protein [Steroidobacter sp.]